MYFRLAWLELFGAVLSDFVWKRDRLLTEFIKVFFDTEMSLVLVRE